MIMNPSAKQDRKELHSDTLQTEKDKQKKSKSSREELQVTHPGKEINLTSELPKSNIRGKNVVIFQNVKGKEFQTKNL